jgi:hypothetical protein
MSWMDAFPQFQNLQTGMLIANSSFKIDMGDKLGVAPLPHFQDGNRANTVTGQSSDPIKHIFEEEVNYAVKPLGYNFYMVFNSESIAAQFQELFNTTDNDISAKLHEIALKVDNELKQLNREN